jgi:hypothetical protein
MSVSRALVMTVVAASLALEFASPAAADDFSGVYAMSLSGAPGADTSWNATSTCRPSGGCVAHVTSSVGWSADARLAGDRWTMMVERPDGQSCPDGTRHSEVQVWTWDAAAMTGLVSGVATDHAACQMGPPDAFTLTAIG